MTATEKIEKVIFSDLLNKSLIFIPSEGASSPELIEVSSKLSRPLSAIHIAILSRWNGLNLDVVRIYGATPTPGELRSIDQVQSEDFSSIQGAIVFADDPSGFIYAEKPSGVITSLNVETGLFVDVASDMDDFFDRLIFGKDAADFAGEDWLAELKDVGII